MSHSSRPVGVPDAIARRIPTAEAGEAQTDGWPVVRVPSSEWRNACNIAKATLGLNFLASLTAVHYLDDGYMLLVAHMYKVASDEAVGARRLVLQTRCDDRIAVEMPSVADIWPTAEWHEREVWDMFGVRFVGNSDHRRILMEEDYEGHPLRKDFEDRKPNLGVSKETLAHDAQSKRET